MNPNAKKQLDKELKESKSLADAFRILEKYYDLENCRPGMFTKAILISKLKDAVTFLKAVPNEKYK